MLGLNRHQQMIAVRLFPIIALEVGMTIHPVYRPKELADLKLINGDEEDFIAICELVKEKL